MPTLLKRDFSSPFVLVPLLLLVFPTASVGTLWAQQEQAQHETAATPTKAQSARETVSAFYESYLKALADNRDPFAQEKPFIKHFVASSLIAEIDRRMKSPDGMEADYFIQAQDYLDDWKGHISVREHEKTAKLTPLVQVLVVTLGAKETSSYRLRVTVKKEAGIWKISNVQKLGAL